LVDIENKARRQRRPALPDVDFQNAVWPDFAAKALYIIAIACRAFSKLLKCRS
jgi:hypothetical protein